MSEAQNNRENLLSPSAGSRRHEWSLLLGPSSLVTPHVVGSLDPGQVGNNINRHLIKVAMQTELGPE